MDAENAVWVSVASRRVFVTQFSHSAVTDQLPFCVESKHTFKMGFQRFNSKKNKVKNTLSTINVNKSQEWANTTSQTAFGSRKERPGLSKVANLVYDVKNVSIFY